MRRELKTDDSKWKAMTGRKKAGKAKEVKVLSELKRSALACSTSLWHELGKHIEHYSGIINHHLYCTLYRTSFSSSTLANNNRSILNLYSFCDGHAVYYRIKSVSISLKTALLSSAIKNGSVNFSKASFVSYQSINEDYRCNLALNANKKEQSFSAILSLI